MLRWYVSCYILTCGVIMRHDFKGFYVCNSFLNFTNNDDVRTFNECNMIKSHSTLLKMCNTTFDELYNIINLPNYTLYFII